MNLPFSFVVVVSDDSDQEGGSVTEWIVHGACDRLPTGPGELSWLPTRVLTCGDAPALSLDVDVLNLIPADELEELATAALMDTMVSRAEYEREEREGGR